MPNSVGNQQRYSVAFILFFLIGSAMVGKELHISSAESQSMATVKGTVMDSNGAVIVLPEPTIIFKRNDEIRRVVVDESGDYEITLPPGVYTVATEIPGFYPFRRAEFCLLPGSDVIINLVPTPRYLVRGTTVSVREAVDTLTPKPKYNEFHVPGRGFSMLIQFEKKRGASEKIEYDRAVLTYDTLTIYADKLSFNRAHLRLKASGKRVIVEDGKQRFGVKQAAVAFKGGEPILELIR